MQEEIEDEIARLERLAGRWNARHPDKRSAFDISIELSNFIHTLKVNFPHASRYYVPNRIAEIHFTDGKENLDYYQNSKLKKKDDPYFYRGIKDIQFGMKDLIRDLKAILDKLDNNTEA